MLPFVILWLAISILLAFQFGREALSETSHRERVFNARAAVLSWLWPVAILVIACAGIYVCGVAIFELFYLAFGGRDEDL